ncbi:DIS3-exonuclease-like protein [Quillaja saponaria]|uniref:DIS3-exonuclease-like protein n=1 Tax=Quillaja saponaria TaxID=32244 RepID=A0AAD7L043_QUISA|nr:DIS3-exonuclease-like protein [Quillaja saponaria]
MLQLFFTVAFSVVPLTLYVPPIRSLNLFLATMEEIFRESRIYTNRMYPRVRVAWSRIMDCMLCNSRLSDQK